MNYVLHILELKFQIKLAWKHIKSKAGKRSSSASVTLLNSSLSEWTEWDFSLENNPAQESLQGSQTISVYIEA